jgi:hypothetical protein
MLELASWSWQVSIEVRLGLTIAGLAAVIWAARRRP